jgi:hypothetical protein
MRAQAPFSFKDLAKAIAEGDQKLFSKILASDQSLALAASRSGASRGSAKAFFFASIGHYILAGDTALHLAAAAHRPAMLKALIKAGADVRAGNRLGATPLHYAADGGPSIKGWRPLDQAITIGILLRAGAEPDSRNKLGVTALQRAVRCRCSAAVQALLKAGADPNLKNRNGSRALDLARKATGRGGAGSPLAKREQFRIIKLLEART